MTNQIQEKKRRRFQFLSKLYEITNGNEYESVNFNVFVKKLGFSQEESNNIHDYLLSEGLIAHVNFGGMIGITHAGIIEIETASSKPDEATEHFSPINIFNVEQMNGSNIQLGTNQSTQNINYSSSDFESILKFVTNLRGNYSELRLDTNAQKEVDSDIETIESQIKSSRPKVAIIKECLQSTRTILEGAAGSVIAGLLLQQLIPLIK